MKKEKLKKDSTGEAPVSETKTEEVSENPEKLEDEEFEGIAEENEEIDEDTIVSLEAFTEELKKANESLSSENKKLSNELEAYKDRLARLTAEYDNFRKRTQKEKEGIYTDACEDILKVILPSFDNVERAYASEGSSEDLKKGLELTLKQFNDSLGKLEIEVIPTDIPFDPNVHNAIMHVEDPQFGENQVVEVFQKGYKKGEKVLRHSLVKVAN